MSKPIHITEQKAAELVCDIQNAAAMPYFAERLPEVYAFCMARRKAGGLWTPDYAVKLLELDRIVSRVQPKTVLEIGSGATSLILKKAPHYACVEDVNWGGTATRIRTGDRVRFDRTAAAAASLLVEGGSLDLLYVDGPNSDSGVEGKPLICTDARDLVEQGIFPKSILFDLRVNSVKEVAPVLFGAGYKAELSGWSEAALDGMWFLAPLRQHTWFYLP